MSPAPPSRAPDDPSNARALRLERSSVFCMAPWTQLHVLPTGEIFSCCMAAEPRDAIGNLRKDDSLEDAWNSPAMRALRRNMLDERPSESCHLCYKGEAVGQSSLRTAENHRMAGHFDVISRTAEDGTVLPFRVPTLDLRFSNVCNLRCRICSAKLSSAWHGDAVALGMADPTQPAILSAVDDPALLLKQVLVLLPHVERLHFAGGEPLISPEHYQLLEQIAPERRGIVQLSYNTNFSRLRFRRWDAVAMWRDFPHVFLQASLDGMGARGELMRKGLDWKDAVANRQRLLAECPHVDFVVHATVSAMNVLHLPEFHRTWLEAGLIGPGGLQLNILHGPPHYNVRALPSQLKDEVERSYRDHLTFLATLGTSADNPRRDFEAVLRYMRAEDWDLTDDFRERNRELDLLRGESLEATFPELEAWLATSTPEERLRSLRLRGRLQPTHDARGELDRLIGELQLEDRETTRRLLRQAYRLRGKARRAAGDTAGATEDFLRASELRDGDLVHVTTGANMAHRRDDEDDPSISTAAVRDAGALYVLARQQRRDGDLAAALQSLGRAVERAPAEAVAWLTRRLAELVEGSDVLLDDSEERPADFFANPAIAYLLRGLAHRATGDFAAARADFDRVTALEPLLLAASAARATLDTPQP